MQRKIIKSIEQDNDGCRHPFFKRVDASASFYPLSLRQENSVSDVIRQKYELLHSPALTDAKEYIRRVCLEDHQKNLASLQDKGDNKHAEYNFLLTTLSQGTEPAKIFAPDLDVDIKQEVNNKRRSDLAQVRMELKENDKAQAQTVKHLEDFCHYTQTPPEVLEKIKSDIFKRASKNEMETMSQLQHAILFAEQDLSYLHTSSASESLEITQARTKLARLQADLKTHKEGISAKEKEFEKDLVASEKKMVSNLIQSKMDELNRAKTQFPHLELDEKFKTRKSELEHSLRFFSDSDLAKRAQGIETDLANSLSCRK